MKTILTSIATGVLIAALSLAQSQPHYLITDLGPMGSPFSQATALNNNGLIAGVAVGADGNQHAILWNNGQLMDLSQPGLGGPNTGAFGVNNSGQVAVQAESSEKDPNNENFCGYGTGLKCSGALWQNGKLTPLQALGGNNVSIGGINSQGQIIGIAENATVDPDCPSTPSINGTGPQVLDFEAVIWGPKPGQIRQLAPLPGDTVGIPNGINDNGQVVGLSGSCANTVLPGFVAGPHAVMWDTDGSVHDLGSLGGTSNPSILAVGNAALAINNQGQVVGTSALPGNKVNQPFLWTKQTGMQALGVLEGDAVGAGLSINNHGDIVGASISEGGPATGNPRAALWSHGQKFDLNDLALPGSPLYLLTACAISDGGQIVGFGVTDEGDVHGFLANPTQTKAVALPKNATVILKSIQLDGTQSSSADGKPLTYVWTIPQGYPQTAITAGTTATPTIQFPSIRGTYMFQLSVTDSGGSTSTDSVTVNYMGN